MTLIVPLIFPIIFSSLIDFIDLWLDFSDVLLEGFDLWLDQFFDDLHD